MVSGMALCAANRWVNPHSGQHKSGCFGVLHSGHALLITEILYVYPPSRAMRRTEDGTRARPGKREMSHTRPFFECGRNAYPVQHRSKSID